METKKIAVIGSGITGTTSAMYLSQKFKNVEVTIFEAASEVGGRTKSITYGNQSVNLGASFFITANQNIFDLINKYKIPYTPSLKDKQAIIAWNGTEILYNSSSRFSFLKLMYKFGWTLFKLKRYLGKKLSRFVEIYKKIDINDKTNFAFENPEEFLKFIDYQEEISKNGYQLAQNVGLNQNFIDVFLYPMSKGIYNANIHQLNGFAMMITLQGMFQKAYSIVGGTDLMIKTILMQHNDFCKLQLNSKVTSIVKLDSSKKHEITQVDKLNKVHKSEFDVVVIAAPINFTDIEFKNYAFPKEMDINKQNRKVIVTIIEGIIRSNYFGLRETDKEIESIFLMEGSESKFGSINCLDRVRTLDNGKFLYKFESSEEVPECLFKELFGEYKLVYHQVWNFAYPSLKPTALDKLPPFRISEGMYFPNAIEFTSSCMEMQTIAAKNVVKLIARNEGKDWELKDQ